MSVLADRLIKILVTTVIAGLLTAGLYITCAAQQLIIYTPYTSVTVSPGESVNYPVDVINKSGSVKNANIVLSGLPKGWTYDLKADGWNISQLAVLPGEKKSFTLALQVPMKINKGSYRFVVAAKGLGQLPLVVNVSQQGTYETAFSSTQPNIEGAANSTFTYNATLRNRTADNQVYALSAYAPPGWNVAFKANYKQVSSVSVDANHTQEITVELDPPDELPAGTYKIPVIAATSGTSAQLELQAVITGSYALELTTPTGLLSTDITAGDDRRIQLVLQNRGSAPLKNIDLQSAAPANWEVSFDPKKIDILEPGKSSQVSAIIKADRKAIAGDYEAALQAKAPEANAKATFRISVRTSFLSGWLGILIILVATGSVYYLFRKYGRR